MQETQRLMAEPVQGISAVPDDNNARYFHVVVAGPSDVSQIIDNYRPFFALEYLLRICGIMLVPRVLCLGCILCILCDGM